MGRIDIGSPITGGTVDVGVAIDCLACEFESESSSRKGIRTDANVVPMRARFPNDAITARTNLRPDHRCDAPGMRSMPARAV